MFKNLRNKVAVLALVAVGLAFGNASGMKSAAPTKTNGKLIYNAIINAKVQEPVYIGISVGFSPVEKTYQIVDMLDKSIDNLILKALSKITPIYNNLPVNLSKPLYHAIKSSRLRKYELPR